MACLRCLQCYAVSGEQTASSEETWIRHFTHISWLSAWSGNTPAQFTVTPFAGRVLHSVFGLFPAHGRAVNADQYVGERSSGQNVRSSYRQCDPPCDNARPTDGTTQQIRNSLQKFDSESQNHPLHSPNLALSDF